MIYPYLRLCLHPLVYVMTALPRVVVLFVLVPLVLVYLALVLLTLRGQRASQ